MAPTLEGSLLTCKSGPAHLDAESYNGVSPVEFGLRSLRTGRAQNGCSLAAVRLPMTAYMADG